MTLAIAPNPTAGTLELAAPALELASKLAKTEFVPAGLRGRPEAIMAAILAGGELGVGPMQSLRSIHIVEGRPTLAAELQRALTTAAGHRIWTEEYTSRKVTLCGQRAGDDHVHKVTWDIADAERAGLATKANWRRYPRQMLLARATSELCRLAFSDVTAGMYAPEDFDTVIDGQDVDEPEKPAPKTKRRRTAQTKTAAAPPSKSSAQTESPAPPLPPLPHEIDTPEEDVVEAEVVEEPPQRDTTAAQRLAIHAAKAGLDDDARHALATEVIGRLVTTFNDLTENGLAAVRAAVDDPAIVRRHLQVSEDELAELRETISDHPDAVNIWQWIREGLGVTAGRVTVGQAEQIRRRLADPVGPGSGEAPDPTVGVEVDDVDGSAADISTPETLPLDDLDVREEP